MKEVVAAFPRRTTRAGIFAVMWSLWVFVVHAAMDRGVLPPGGAGLAVLIGAVGTGLTAAGLYLARYRRRKRRWSLDDKSLLLDGHRIERARIESGIIVDQPEDKARLDLRLADGEPIELGFASRDEAKTLLNELALDPSRRRTRVSLEGWRYHSLIVGSLVFFLSAVSAFTLAPATQSLRNLAPEVLRTPILMSMVMLLATSYFALAARFAPELVIGSDGLAFRVGTLRRRQLIMYERVNGVSAALRQHEKDRRWFVELSMVDGSKLVIGSAASGRRAEVEASVQQIYEAIEAWKLAATSPSARLALLDQKELPVTDWLSNLRTLARQKADYRSITLRNDELELVVADASASVRHRIGAAVVLAARDERAGRERVRVAADTSVSPKIRVVLDAIAQGEELDEAVQEAIDEENQQQEASA